MIIKGASGFGDNIYLNPIVKYYSDRNTNVKVITKFPELYEDINCTPIESASRCDVKCSYVFRKKFNTSQWEDTKILAQCETDLKLHLELKPSLEVEDFVFFEGDYIFCSNLYKPSFKHDVNLIIDETKISNEVNKLKKKYSCNAYSFGSKGLPITGVTHSKIETTTHDILYLIKNAKYVIGQFGYIIPASEVFNKNCLAFLPNEIKNTNDDFVKTIKPNKLIAKETTEIRYL